MKRLDLFLLFILLPLDFAAIFLAGLAAYFLRFGSFVEDWRPAVQIVPFKEYLLLVAVIAFLWLLIFALAGLYGTRPKKFFDEFITVFLASSAGTILLISAIFFKREFFASRFIILAGFVFSVVFVAFFRFLINRVRRYLRKRGFGVQNILIVGEGRMVEIIKNEFDGNPYYGFRIVKVVPKFDETQVNDLIKSVELDEMILVGPNFSPQELKYIVEYALSSHLDVKYAADVLGGQLFRIKSFSLAGIPFIEVKTTPLEGWGRIYKRAFDATASLVLLLILLPFLAVVYLLIFLTSRGPVIYKNERVGAKGKLINVFKFRTMYKEYCTDKQFSDSDKALEFEEMLISERGIKSGPVYKIANDPRVTPAGRRLRRWSIDELPQLLNVLIGNMSLVGPRPHQAREVEKYRKADKKILNVKPGITGLAQISGRADLSFEEEARLDIYYIENWSPGLDFYILLKTPGTVLNRKGAY